VEETPPEKSQQRTEPAAKPARRAPPTPGVVVQRLRSRIPVSPLPWHWDRRLRRGALAAVILLVVGGALASVLLQGDESSSERPALDANVSPEVGKLVGGLSLEEKLDAVLVAGFDDPDRLPAGTPGGVLITADSWPGESKGKALTKKLHAAGGKSPPLIVTQQEGGDHRALSDLPPSESELEVGAIGTTGAAETWALATGKALEANGIDLNLAPVADVATLDSPISDRAFSDDPALVTELTVAALRGCRESGVACAVSHFPGLGGASEDTTAGPATVSLDPASLEARDLPPFRAAFEQKVPAVVLSLAFYAAYDPVTPAALSSAITEDLLRDQLGFKGVALTDDLSSGAIAAGQGAPDSAPAALAAGADMVVISDPGEAEKARETIQKAVKDGSIPADRLDQAVARVLELKRRLGLL
jgi:beta-N-acetylhexosaminidase